MTIIDVQQCSKEYRTNGGAVTALRGVDLAVSAGEFTAIAGPSGSGKTTLLNLVGGLDRPTTGRLTLAGRELTACSPRELADLRLRSIGFIFQAYNLIPVLTALENVEYLLLLQGVPKAERRERAARVLADVGLERERDRLPRALSGGQQQRVAVARAIASEPAIVLADEPTANLDQRTGAALLDLMRGLNRDRGITFLFSTHDPMVMDRAGRLVRLADGAIASDEVRGAVARSPKRGR